MDAAFPNKDASATALASSPYVPRGGAEQLQSIDYPVTVDKSLMAHRRFETVPVMYKGSEVETSAIVTSPITTQIFLKPLAFPSTLGLTGFFASTFIIATWLCGWFGGSSSTPTFMFFVLLMGGIGQAIAGLYGFPARDNFAVVLHWTWGSYSMYFAFTQLIAVMGFIPFPADRWYSDGGEATVWGTLMTITWICCAASLSRGAALGIVTSFLALGATLMIPGRIYGSESCCKAAGYFFLFSSLGAIYHITLTLLLESWGTVPNWLLLKTPWDKQRGQVSIPINEPGVKKGE